LYSEKKKLVIGVLTGLVWGFNATDKNDPAMSVRLRKSELTHQRFKKGFISRIKNRTNGGGIMGSASLDGSSQVRLKKKAVRTRGPWEIGKRNKSSEQASRQIQACFAGGEKKRIFSTGSSPGGGGKLLAPALQKLVQKGTNHFCTVEDKSREC